jgi:hypothetical protein
MSGGWRDYASTRTAPALTRYTDWNDGSGTNTGGEILYRRKNVGALSARR